MYLQVPVLQGMTTAPEAPEFHGGHTPVFWRFGFDLTERLRENGFDTTLLTIESFALNLLTPEGEPWPEAVSLEFDLTSIAKNVDSSSIVVAVDFDRGKALGFVPSYMYITWECTKRINDR